MDSEHAEDQRRHQPGQRPGDADVEQARRLPMREPMRITAPKVPNGGMGMGIRSGKLVWTPFLPRLQEMAHFVADENGHHGGGVLPAAFTLVLEIDRPTNQVLKQVAMNRARGSQTRRRRTGGVVTISAVSSSGTSVAIRMSGSGPAPSFEREIFAKLGVFHASLAL